MPEMRPPLKHIHNGIDGVHHGAALVLALTEPPPVTGQSIAAAMLLRALERRGALYHKLDMNRSFHRRWALTGYAHRILRLGTLPLRLVATTWPLRGERVVFYLQLGHRVAAMVRDLPLLALADRRGWATVLHVHGGGFRESYERAPAPVRRAIGYMVARAERIVVLSSGLRAMFGGLARDERVVVIPNGVPEEVARAAQTRTAAAGSAAGLRVLFLTNLMEEKGYADFLQLAAASERLGWPHEFTIAGERTETTTIDPASFIARARLRRTRYVGAVSGLAKCVLLADADVLVLPTRALEGQPIAVLEAMHHGLPIISTALGGLNDLVSDGVGGFVVPPRDLDALLAALNRLASDRSLCARMSQHNRAVATARYTEQAYGDAMIRLLLDVAAGMQARVSP